MSSSQTTRNNLHLILLGAPGSGKGTQAAYLKERFGLVHISTGDILRAEVKAGSDLGLAAQGFMERGELVPDDLIVSMMEVRLAELGTTTGYVLDGFPRTVAQAAALDAMLSRIDHTLDAVVTLDVADEELIRRLTGRRVCSVCNAVFHVDTMKPKVDGICDVCGGALIQRKDDQLDAITNRLRVYQVQTEPLIKYYSDLEKLVRIDGTIGVPEVAEAIFLRLDEAN
jgi:adenylate kinase